MDRAKFFDGIRPLFARKRLTRVQVQRLEAVLDGLQLRGMMTARAAYVLATAHHESDQFRTLEEYASGKAYEGREDLGNTKPGDGERFKGRGLVQITGRRNYADWAERTGIPFVTHPDLAGDLEFAVPILIDGMTLGTFTGKCLADYIAGDRCDFYNARRIVNGTDKAAHIAVLAKKYQAALKEAGYGKSEVGIPTTLPKPAKPVSAQKPVPAPDTPAKPEKPSTALPVAAFAALMVVVVSAWEWLAGFFSSIAERIF